MKIRVKMEYAPTIFGCILAFYVFAELMLNPDVPVDIPLWSKLICSLLMWGLGWLFFHVVIAPILILSGLYNSRLRRIHKHH